MKRVTPLFFFASVALAFQSPQAPQVESIRKDAMRADVFFLAGDAMRGRLVDTPENFLAAEYIKSRFERIGLKPGGQGRSYYQSYNLMTASLEGENSLEAALEGGATLRLQPGQDYYPHNFSASGRVRGEVVFAGFGITAPDLSYDDYRGEDLGGKIVLVLDGEPGERDPASPFDGLVRAEESSQLRKALFAQDRGAAGILFVQAGSDQPGRSNFAAAAQRYWPERPPRIARYTLASWAEKVRIPAAEISPGLGEILVRGASKSLQEFARSAETASGIGPSAIPGVRIDLTTSVRRHIIPDRNVVGMIEGSDPVLKDEHVIICAHYDHNGADGDQVYNGADDAVSGIVAMTEMAEAYVKAAQAGRRARRTIVFGAWDAEERGLLGAWAYADDPTLPLSKTVAVLNLDMIGRNEEVPEGGGGRFRGLEIQSAESNSNSVNVIGTVRCPDLKAAAVAANGSFGLDLRFRYDNNVSNLMRRSDHWPFIQYGVPALWFLTGLHPDYHTIYDRPEKLNYDKMEKIARMVYQMSWNLAQQDARPKLLPRK